MMHKINSETERRVTAKVLGIIKTMNKTLEQMIKQYKDREKNLRLVPCEIEDFEIKLKAVIDELGKATNKPVTL